MIPRPHFFQSLSETITQVHAEIDERNLVLDAGVTWSEIICAAGPINYGFDRRFDFSIATLKNKPTRKYFHVNIWRDTEGRYELNTYVL